MLAGHAWTHLLYSRAVVRMIQRKYILSLIYGADGHQGSRGHGPHWNTSQNVAIQERTLSSVDYALQHNAWTNPNAGRQAISANVTPNAISTEHLQCSGLDEAK